MRRRGGFTLLEALVALVIVGVGAVAGIAAFGAALRGETRARSALEAAALADDRLAALRLVDRAAFDHLPDSTTGGTFEAPFAAYRWQTSARAVSGEPGLYVVAVVVEWNDGTYELRSRLFRPWGPHAAR